MRGSTAWRKWAPNSKYLGSNLSSGTISKLNFLCLSKITVALLSKAPVNIKWDNVCKSTYRNAYINICYHYYYYYSVFKIFLLPFQLSFTELTRLSHFLMSNLPWSSSSWSLGLGSPLQSLWYICSNFPLHTGQI